MSTPCALFTSCSPSLTAGEVIRRILSVEELPESVHVLEDVYSYPWHIDTKYYTADVLLCTTADRTIGDKSFAEAVQAFVIMFDSREKSNLDQVSMWLPYLEELQPAVQILVCEECTEDDEVSHDTAIQWCLKNSFELVELSSRAVDSDDSDEDDFKETVGIPRIIEALSCHSWPNLVMKEKPVIRSSYIQQLMQDAAHTLQAESSNNDATLNTVDSVDKVTSEHQHSSTCDTASSQLPVDSSKTTQQLIDMLVASDVATGTSHSHADGRTDVADDDDSFEQLFEQLRIMKEAAGGLSAEDRKKYAEQVTMQFWQAIGGNADEFEGLSSQSD